MLAEKTIKKEVGVLYIEPKRVKEYWPLAEFMVKEGLQYDGNPMSVLEMKKRIESGEYQLFIMFGSDKNAEYAKLRLSVNKTNKDIISVFALGKDGSRYTLKVNRFSPDKPLAADTFVFKPAKYEGFHIEDLR